VSTILVSGASGIVGYGILKSLHLSGHTLIGTTIYKDSVAPAFCDILEIAPLTSEPGYVDWLCNLIQKRKIDMAIPGIEADMYKWNENRDKFVALLNNPDLVALCQDKWVFYTKIKENSLSIDSRIDGSFEEIKEEYGLPFLLKPRRGYSSKGIVIVDSEEVFELNKAKYSTILMAQPIVGSAEEEYTASAFFDKSHNMCSYMTLKRKLSKEGFTDRAQTVDIPAIKEAILELAFLKPVGPTNFQFRVHKGQLKLLEINPRISSSTSIRAVFGYNEAVMSVEYFLNGKVPTQPNTTSGTAVRYVEEQIFHDSHNF
jgi:carbamoyl-phosphate synthase large subunit